MNKLNVRLPTINEMLEGKRTPPYRKRRSKSFTMDNRDYSFNNKDSKIVTTKSPESVNNNNNDPIKRSNHLRTPIKAKRSKSVIDLRKNKTPLKIKAKSYTELIKRKKDEHSSNYKPKKTPKMTPLATLGASYDSQRLNNLKMIKQKKHTIVKNKSSDWEYKARFMLLSEKYSTLQEDYNQAKQKLLVLDSAEQQLNWLQENFDKKEKKINELMNENKKQKHRIYELEEFYSQYKDCKNNYNILLDNYGTSLKIIEDLKIELNHLRQIKIDLQQKITKNEQYIKELNNELLKYEKNRKILHNTIQELKGNIRIFCRVRPPINSIELRKQRYYINFIDKQTINVRRNRSIPNSIQNSKHHIDNKIEFQFDNVFPPHTPQSIVFDEMSQLVQSALDGYNVCIFAYGQTGSGKTFTLQGGNTPETLGIIPRSVDLIFNTIKNLEKLGWVYTIQASFLEIFNEIIIDLLDPDNKETKEIRYNDGKGLMITNITIKTIQTADELKDYMILAQNKRALAVTDVNEHSSLSHAITRIELKGVHSDINTIYMGSINFIDLAGSETTKYNSNQHIYEMKNINKSLANFSNVMLALQRKDTIIPYKNSKLTYLLQSCLGGNSKTLIIINIAPFDECYTENLNTLRFSAIVKDVKSVGKRR